MTSAGPAIFFTLGILSSFSSCTVLASCLPCSTLLRNSGSNFSFWHETPMSSGGSSYVYTCPVLRSNLKFDVLKNLLSVGQLNNIMTSVVSSGSLCSIRSPILVLQKSGTYQSRAMVLFFCMNSLMASSFVLCNSTVGFMSGFGGPCNCSISASFSMRCAMALCCCLLTSLFTGVFSCWILSFML